MATARCDICDKPFKSAGALSSHIRLKHDVPALGAGSQNSLLREAQAFSAVASGLATLTKASGNATLGDRIAEMMAVQMMKESADDRQRRVNRQEEQRSAPQRNEVLEVITALASLGLFEQRQPTGPSAGEALKAIAPFVQRPEPGPDPVQMMMLAMAITRNPEPGAVGPMLLSGPLLEGSTPPPPQPDPPEPGWAAPAKGAVEKLGQPLAIKLLQRLKGARELPHLNPISGA